jgi:hypothetical protein
MDTIITILAVCAIQIFGYRNATGFLRKKLESEPTEAKLSRLHGHTGSDTARKTLSRYKESLIKKLESKVSEGERTQWFALIPFTLGMCVSFIGILSYFGFMQFPFIDVSSSTELICFGAGLLISIFGLRLALPGMLMELSAQESIRLLKTKY